jgi:hypothetical protein
VIAVERLRALPVEVAAVRFTGFGPDGNGFDVLQWLGDLGITADRYGDTIRMQTTEREPSTAFPLWTIVIGTEGEVYPISPAVRARKYERVQP